MVFLIAERVKNGRINIFDPEVGPSKVNESITIKVFLCIL